MPAWRSQRLCVREVPYEYTLESVKKSISFAHEKLPPGRMFGRGSSPYELLRAKHPELLRTEQIAIICRKHGTTRDRVIRSAIETESGLLRGRFGPRSVDEVRTTIRWALEDGMTLDPGWAMRWDSFARKRPYLETYSWLGDILRREGKSLKAVAFAVQVRHVEGVRPISPIAADPGVARTDRTLLVYSLSSSDLTKFGYDRGKLILLRQRGRLFHLKVEKDQSHYYPRWQFAADMEPHPVVPELLRIVRSLDLNEWDLEEVMSEEVGNKGARRSLRDHVDGTKSNEWLVAHVKYRLEVRRRDQGR